MRGSVLAALLFSFSALPAHAATPRPDVGMAIVDVLLVRPLCVVGSLVTTALSLGTLPITVPTGVGDESAVYLIHAPWRFTAGRVPGDFDSYEDGGDILGP